MTYRDPNEPLGQDSPTEAYRAPTPADPAAPTPPPTGPQPAATWPSRRDTAPPPEGTQAAIPPAPRGRQSRARWVVALVVVALVIVASGVAAALLTGKAPDAAVLGWVPEDSVTYGELRLDLPGDQRANLGEFLSKFPGFRDQASLDTKIDEVLDRVVSSASNGEQTYTADIAPWFAGEIAFSMGELPDAATLTDPESRPALPEFVAYLSLTDEARAQAWFDDAVADVSPSTEDYNGTRLTLVDAPHSSDGDGTMAFGIPSGGRVAILGEETAVKAALDTRGEGGLADDADFAAALAASEDDHVGFLFLNLRRYMDWALSTAPAGSTDMCGTAFTDDMTDLVPGWVSMRGRVEGDGLVLDTAAPLPAERLVEQQNRASSLAGRLPASTIVFAAGQDIGATVLATIEMYRSDPACAEAFESIDAAVGFLGGFDDVLGWMGEGAIVINRTADGVEGGLVLQATSADDATDLLATLKTLVSLGGASAGVSIREETHGDATITVLDLGDAASLFAVAGMAGGVPLPPLGETGTRVELAWTVSGDLVVLSAGTDFVKHVLDTDEGSSLASDARYAALLERTGGRENTGVLFADITALRELLEQVGREDADSFSSYETELQPFLLPFDAFMQSSVVDGERAANRALITVK